ncbi:MAG: DUF4330 domain-containing protein, partial [Clostridia bacterium]|nr:DUF4330 domain-containing protein [Clostridia bacterium]
MKIINEKGKLFGIINVVDLLVILLIVLIAAGATYKTANNAASGSSQKVEYTILLQCIRPEPAEAITVGDKLVANNNYTTAVITGVESRPGHLVSTTAEGDRVMVNDPY